MPSRALTDAVRAACARRDGLPYPALRLFDGAADGVPGLVIERFADAIRARGPARLAPEVAAIRAGLPDDAPFFWRFTHAHAGGPPGDDGARVAREHDLRFAVQLQGARNTGLFLDARPARAWVRAHAADRRVLNLFAYTCGFGVAAAAGGARSTVNVDAAPGALARGRANYALNELPADGRTFWKSDVLDALKRARRGGARFDGVVLDPPPVAQPGGAGRRMDASRDLARLLAACRAVLAPGGWLLVLARPASPPDDALSALVDLGAPRWSAGPDADFRDPCVRARAFWDQPR
ncbi:MAG: class I SAM-dependent methyltransferase [Myxococcales bacterium]|nr:class I SAM-dependent methyltransferase [Myxococcales bacterium]